MLKKKKSTRKIVTPKIYLLSTIYKGLPATNIKANSNNKATTNDKADKLINDKVDKTTNVKADKIIDVKQSIYRGYNSTTAEDKKDKGDREDKAGKEDNNNNTI